MSCFESSTFTKNPDVMDQNILIEACNKLGWSYNLQGEELTITDVNQKESLHGEFALKVVGNRVSYNTYYLKNAKEKLNELQTTFESLNVEYAKTSIVKTFKSKGFVVKKNRKFKKTQDEIMSFFMVGRSEMEGEEEPIDIKFIIKKDGTIISDSDYIPADVHELADEAMLSLEKLLGCNRREGIEIKRKPIPLKYKHKTHCSVNNKVIAKNK